MPRWRVTAAVLVAAGAVLGHIASASAQSAAGGKGTVEVRTYASPYGPVSYLVYLPVGYRKGERWPLLVLLHGCGATAEIEMNADQVNPIADAERFVVMYPNSSSQVGDTTGCWRAIHGDATSQRRGLGGDADIVAGMTQATKNEHGIDPERVYLIGMSSGAFQASATGAAYPDVYAAIGVDAGGGYGMNWSCVTMTDDLVSPFAQLAVNAMGVWARVMPFFAIGGTADALGEQPAPGGCSRLAFEQWMATDNLLAPSQGSGDTYALDSSSTVKGKVRGGYRWTREVFRDRKGCQIGEHWIVDGLGHYWSGGSADPKWEAYTDPKGPSAGLAAWTFFRQFTLDGANRSCPSAQPAEQPAAPGRPWRTAASGRTLATTRRGLGRAGIACRPRRRGGARGLSPC